MGTFLELHAVTWKAQLGNVHFICVDANARLTNWSRRFYMPDLHLYPNPGFTWHYPGKIEKQHKAFFSFFEAEAQHPAKGTLTPCSYFFPIQRMSTFGACHYFYCIFFVTEHCIQTLRLPFILAFDNNGQRVKICNQKVNTAALCTNNSLRYLS